jgi:hypothetical protein
MNTLKSIIVALCLTLFFSVANAQDDSKDITIKASGSGKTLEDAKQAALRSSTQQAFGAFISSKTEIFNDQLVADQMASVSSGNIKSYEVLNESQLPDGSWGVTLKVLVSISKLTSFVEGKGIAIEIKGGMFALNIKQQLLNEQGEIAAVCEMVGLLHEPMQISFDYVIKSNEPKSLDAESKNWAISLEVTATANKNMDFCANYCIKTLKALSLSDEEVANYKSLNKAVFPVEINYKGFAQTFFLRKIKSVHALNTFLRQWGFYTSSFTVQSGLDEFNGNSKYKMSVFSSTNNEQNFRFDCDEDNADNDPIASYHNFGTKKNFENLKSEGLSQMRLNIKSLDIITIFTDINLIQTDELSTTTTTINFLTVGQKAAIFSWQDKRTLAQIEQMTGYKVKPNGVVSQFKLGGFVVYENNGHGLVAAILNLGFNPQTDLDKDYNDLIYAKALCEGLNLNGYSDWRLPTKYEFIEINLNLKKLGVNLFGKFSECEDYLGQDGDRRGLFWLTSDGNSYRYEDEIIERDPNLYYKFFIQPFRTY